MPRGRSTKPLVSGRFAFRRRRSWAAQWNGDAWADMQEVQCGIVFNRDAAGKIQCLKRTLPEIDRTQNSN